MSSKKKKLALILICAALLLVSFLVPEPRDATTFSMIQQDVTVIVTTYMDAESSTRGGTKEMVYRDPHIEVTVRPGAVLVDGVLVAEPSQGDTVRISLDKDVTHEPKAQSAEERVEEN